ncbi:MAG TPA: hypothetical protein VFC50_01995 [Candidatus Dormibacteraeota bacterium]|nr:hypothetical protein [Candidatus Dormibacteraeota bacterium]
MKYLSGKKIWWMALPLVMVLFLSLLPGKTSADNGTYRYTNGNKSVVGPDPADQNSTLTFTKNGVDLKKYPTGVYFSGNGTNGPNGNLCPDIYIFTSDGQDGSSSADIKSDCGSDIGGISKDYGSITITGKQSPQIGQWIDHSHISVGSSVYYDNKEDNNLSFVLQNSSDSCSAKNYINGFPNSDGSNYQNATASATIHLFTTPGGGNNNCVETDDPITLSPNSDPAGFNYYFVWQDSGTISTSDQTAIVFTQNTAGSGPYMAAKGRSYNKTCQSQISGASGWPTSGTLVIKNSSSDNPLSTGFPSIITGASLHSDGQGCYESDGILIQLADTKGADGKLASDEAAGSSGVGGGGGGSSSQDLSLNCHAGLNPLNWLVCGIVKGLVGIVSALDGAINSELSVGTNGNSDNPDQIFANPDGSCGTGGQCDAYHTAWGYFRDIALGLIALATILVLIAQALGLEMLDAYTIRKVLPRLLIASIAIAMSWQLMRFFITLTNDLGFGIRRLIEAPFIGINTSIHLSLSQSAAVLIPSIVGVAMGVFGLLTFVGMAALAVVVGFATLILRALVVIGLTILSPLGIAAYILPNPYFQRAFKFWWENFSKALFMFPLIAGFIAIGRVFSAIAVNQSSDILSQIIGFIAYFAPYLMIPMTFKFAGGALGGMANLVNSRAQGGYGYLSKKRKEHTAGRVQRARAGYLWNPEFGRFGKNGRSVGRMGSRLAEWAFDADEMVPGKLGQKGTPGFKRFAAGIENKIDDAMIDHSTKGWQEIESKGGMHYEGWRALSGSYRGFSEETQKQLMDEGFIDRETGVSRAPRSLKDIDKITEILGSSGREKEQLAAAGLHTARGTLANISNNPELFRADVQTMGALGLANAGRAEQQDLAEIGNSITARKGKGGGASYAQSVVKKASDAGARLRPETRWGHGVMVDKDGSATGTKGKFYSVFDDNSNLTAAQRQKRKGAARSNAMSIKASDWTGAKAEAVQSARLTNMDIAREKDDQGNYTGAARAMQDLIVNQAGPYGYNDTGAKAEWSDMSEELRKEGVPLPKPRDYDPREQARQQQDAAEAQKAADEAARNH